jgi:uncharacterized protein with NRDE domain
MCTIGILHHAHPEVPLVVIANRDEFYGRPARPPEVLDSRIGAAGGVDAQSGGTWLGLTRTGRVVAVTNQRAAVPAIPNVRSRGLAVRDALAAPDLDAYVRALDPRELASMNLLYGDARGLSVAYFRHDAGTLDVAPLPPGVHVLCNDRMGAPGFPRGDRLAAGLLAAVDAPWSTARARLAALLGDHARADLADLEPLISSGRSPEASARREAPLTRELLHAMTAICIHSPLYGTRSSAIVELDDGRVRRYLHAEGAPCTAPFVDYTHLVS